MEMTRHYGHTVYNISAYSSPDSDSTYEEKLLQLIRYEIDKLPAGTQYDEKWSKISYNHRGANHLKKRRRETRYENENPIQFNHRVV